MSNLIQMFPDHSRNAKKPKKEPVDYGLDNDRTKWKIIKSIVWCLIGVIVGIPLLIIFYHFLKDFDFNVW